MTLKEKKLRHILDGIRQCMANLEEYIEAIEKDIPCLTEDETDRHHCPECKMKGLV
jgi:hypothetical protein